MKLLTVLEQIERDYHKAVSTGSEYYLDEGLCSCVSEISSSAREELQDLLIRLKKFGKIACWVFPVEVPEGSGWNHQLAYDLVYMYQDFQWTGDYSDLEVEWVEDYRLNRLALLEYLIEYLKGEL